MNIHEYQGKQILARHGVSTLAGAMATTARGAREAVGEIGGDGPWVVKAQIHAGGRGKAGGVKLVRSADEAEAFAASILGKPLVTHQTGPEGRVVRRLLIEEGMDLGEAREMYLAVLVDRATSRPVVMASAQGGMDIEEVAAKDPDAILKEHVDPAVGFQPYQTRKLAAGLGLTGGLIGQAVPFLT